MNPFSYENRTKMILCTNEMEVLESIVLSKKVSCILLVHQLPLTKGINRYQLICDLCARNNIQLVEVDDIRPNPLYQSVIKGLELTKRHQVDCVVAIGGGSVIDVCKVIAAGATYDGDIKDFVGNKPMTHTPLPFIVIPTIAASGSETSAGAVISDDQTHYKLSFRSNCLRPDVTIYNPLLMNGVPKYAMNCGIADMFSHNMERYFNGNQSPSISDYVLLGMMRGIVALTNQVTVEDKNAQLMIASSMSQSGILGLGRTTEWTAHFIAHELSTVKDVAHGASVTVIFGAWMKYVYQTSLDQFTRYAAEVFDVDGRGKTMEQVALEGIEKTVAFFKKLELPTSLEEVNIDESYIETMAHNVLDGREQIGVCKKLNYEDICAIYRIALKKEDRQ